MDSVADKLQYTLDAVSGIQRAIIDKGVPVSNGIELATYESKIREIGNTPRPPGYFGVFFTDYNGIPVRTVWVTPGGAVASKDYPPGPDHTGDELEFQEWNWSLDDLTNIDQDIIVGANYRTTDGKTHLDVLITDANTVIGINIYRDGGAGTLLVEWADGTTSQSTAVAQNVYFTHNFATPGRYRIKYDVINGPGTYRISGGASGQQAVVGTGRLIEVHMGDKVPFISSYAFVNIRTIESISIHKGCSMVYMYAFQASGIGFFAASRETNTFQAFAFNVAYRLRGFSVRKAPVTWGQQQLYGCYACEPPYIAEGCTTIPASWFYHPFRWKVIRFPESLTSIGGGAFWESGYVQAFVFTSKVPPSISADSIGNPTKWNETLQIFVPDESIDLYKSASGFIAFAGKILPLSEFNYENYQ